MEVFKTHISLKEACVPCTSSDRTLQDQAVWVPRASYDCPQIGSVVMLEGEPGWGWGAADKIVLEKHLQNSSWGRGESNNCKAKRMRQRRHRNESTKDESE